MPLPIDRTVAPLRCLGARAPALVAALAMALTVTACARFHAAPPPGAPSDATFLDVDGVRLRYIDEGEGPAVLLVHGFAASLDTFKGVRRALGGKRRVLAVDLKGFGYSGRPAGDYGPEAQARLLAAFLRQRGVDRVAVVAHSWGSGVALALALQAPGLVERLALYDAWVFEAQLPPFFLWARAAGLGEALFALVYDQRAVDRLELAFYDVAAVPQGLVDHALAGIARPGTTAAHLAAVRGQRYGELQTRYASVIVPTLLLWGRDDRVTPLHYGERLARTLPAAQLRVYPRCGHFPMIEAAAASTADLLAFLGVDAAAARVAGGGR